MAGFPHPANMELFSRMCRTHNGLARLVSALVWAGAVSFGLTTAHAFESAVPDRFGQVPLMFEAAGVTGSGAVSYRGQGAGYRVLVGPTRLEVAFQAADGPGQLDRARGAARLAAVPRRTGRLGFGMELVGANATAGGSAEQELPTRVNYFMGNDPAAWRTGVSTHGRVRYREVYPGIDLVYYGNQRQLEHDFEVTPGADAGLIRWRFEGTDELALEPDGTLVVSVGPASLRFRPPQVYQWNGGEREFVPAAYRLEAGARGEVGFAVAPYDPTRSLVIDPVLVYSTFLGGLDYEQANGVAVDGFGQVYVVGETASTNFPVANALYPTNAGGYDGTQNPYGNEAFVAKLGAEGTNLVFATYLGGDGLDVAVAVALDAVGNPVITGLTGSTNFPVTAEALQPRIAGEADLGLFLDDGFVVKLSANGEALLYSTYIGGVDEDQGLAIALDEAGAVYVAGYTESEDFPVRNNTTVYRDLADVFVLKFRIGEPDLTYSMLLGGSDYDFAQALAVDQYGQAYVFGDAGSSEFPVTNAFQPKYGGGDYDAFLAKVSAAGDGLVFSTFLGGGSQDEGLGLALDDVGNAFLTGYTSSSSFPVTNALYDTKASSRDVFVSKFDAAGRIQYSSFLGGRSDEQGWAIAVDAAGSVYVAGMTQSSDFPLTNALQTVYQGNRDIFITKLSPSGQGLAFSTFLGGPNSDEARALAVDAAGSAYVAGYTASTSFPVEPAATAVQRVYGGGIADAFVLKVVPSVVLSVRQPAAGTVILSWPAGLTDYVLESTVVLDDTGSWMAVPEDPTVIGGLQLVTVANASGHRFYRLRQLDD